MSKEKEYESLRKEILEWQKHRFAIASGGLLAVAGIIGWTINKPYDVSWVIVSGFILCVISIANYLSYLFGLSKTKISTYIEVFHEGSGDDDGCWERRQKEIKKTSSRKAFTVLYICIGLFGIGIPFAFCRKVVLREDYVIGIVGAVSFLVTTFLSIQSPPYENFRNKWKEVEREDAKNKYEKIKESALPPT